MCVADGLRYLDLFPEDLFVLELFDPRLQRLRGVDSRDACPLLNRLRQAVAIEYPFESSPR
jgi:hypothetical protein